MNKSQMTRIKHPKCNTCVIRIRLIERLIDPGQGHVRARSAKLAKDFGL